MWITLCVTAYKAGFCCGMQRTVIFIEFSPCQPERTPYNAPPSTRHNGLRNAVLRGSGN
ncbi:Uncharacterized protein {ECO:0000313/EMBL:AER34532.1} [Pantoea ananatis]|nr:hypothetical protein PAGR_g4047 [Pantoea ananatis PA13]CRH27672.1 Uncharacterized protein {ECO:0000313/EMBL:AER34532.1} [Pantoea ananatis]CRH32046.1 Uncharacterized protein BN1183_AB_00950 [Pantoea ananatis]CRH35494.1 Uncharacterized protein {ECO:0000313/EMBL:AER34532.1} [Pantoea ananatis]